MRPESVTLETRVSCGASYSDLRKVRILQQHFKGSLQFSCAVLVTVFFFHNDSYFIFCNRAVILLLTIDPVQWHRLHSGGQTQSAIFGMKANYTCCFFILPPCALNCSKWLQFLTRSTNTLTVKTCREVKVCCMFRTHDFHTLTQINRLDHEPGTWPVSASQSALQVTLSVANIHAADLHVGPHCCKLAPLPV